MDNEGSSTPKRRRQKGSAVNGGDMFPVDRISNLPETLIFHILSLLPTKSAVVTSFLSKSWRLRWTKVNTFDFDYKLWTDEVSEEEMDFTEFINLVFVNHTEPIHKLRLRWLSCAVRPVYLSIWLKSAIARNIRELDLAAEHEPQPEKWKPDHDDEIYEFKLPAALYTCGSLEVLKLKGPFLVQLPHTVSLPNLLVLEFNGVKYECDESVEKLIIACPVLHSFKIRRYHYHGDLLLLKISSNSLKSLQINFQHECELCVFSDDLKLVIDTPALEDLVIGSELIIEIICVQRLMLVNELIVSGTRGRHNCIGVPRLLQACDSVSVMKLWEPAIHALFSGTTPLPATFGRLTNLTVGFPRSQWSILLDLIDRCFNLQKLDISVCEIARVDEAEGILESLGGSYWRHPVRVPGCFSSSLKHVYFGPFQGREDEMAMLKFILDHGLLIETVSLFYDHCILPCRYMKASERFEILNKVSMLRRASTACTISYS